VALGAWRVAAVRGLGGDGLGHRHHCRLPSRALIRTLARPTAPRQRRDRHPVATNARRRMLSSPAALHALGRTVPDPSGLKRPLGFHAKRTALPRRPTDRTTRHRFYAPGRQHDVARTRESRTARADPGMLEGVSLPELELYERKSRVVPGEHSLRRKAGASTRSLVSCRWCIRHGDVIRMRIRPPAVAATRGWAAPARQCDGAD
jgi:hypothetical protein